MAMRVGGLPLPCSKPSGLNRSQRPCLGRMWSGHMPIIRVLNINGHDDVIADAGINLRNRLWARRRAASSPAGSQPAASARQSGALPFPKCRAVNTVRNANAAAPRLMRYQTPAAPSAVFSTKNNTPPRIAPSNEPRPRPTPCRLPDAPHAAKHGLRCTAGRSDSVHIRSA